MKSSFEFDGKNLVIRLTVEDENEIAVAKLMESYNVATVSIDRGRYGDYGYSHRELDPKAVEILLRKPPEKEPEF